MKILVASLCTSLVAVSCQTPQRPASPQAALAPSPPPPTSEPAPLLDEAFPPDSEIVTQQVIAMNAPQHGRPPNKFRSGHVVKSASPKAVSTATGFEVRFGASTITTPTIYDRKVIVSGGFNSKELYAFEAKTGKPVWGITFDDDGPSNPACERGVCIINTESCTIFAINARTGDQLWSWWLGDPLTSAPTIADGRVFTAFPASQTAEGRPPPPGASHVLAAFDLKTGAVLWDLWLDSDVMSAPVAVDDFVYVTTFAGTVIKVEQATGRVRYAMRAQATSAPVVQFQDGVESMFYTRRGEAEHNGAEEMIIRADHNEPKTRYQAAKKKASYIDRKAEADKEYSLLSDLADTSNGFSDGAPASAQAHLAAKNVGVASVASMQGFQGSRVLRMGKRNVNTMGDEVIATDADTGAVLWRNKLAANLKAGGFAGTAPVPAGTSVLTGTLTGEVRRFNSTDGKLLRTYKVGSPIRSQPVLSDGWIYLGTEDGRLVAINTHDSSITGWPTWGGNPQRTGIQLSP